MLIWSKDPSWASKEMWGYLLMQASEEDEDKEEITMVKPRSSRKITRNLI